MLVFRELLRGMAIGVDRRRFVSAVASTAATECERGKHEKSFTHCSIPLLLFSVFKLRDDYVAADFERPNIASLAKHALDLVFGDPAFKRA
ncbi:hypothetical protein, partial [Bradyrhizobium sp. SZCCHNR3109]|uniref:hypothetical protein n=1 Tax=Bradyrhizobium sp. SZCCHNR3109 TaxID=3057461 RepID=UPI0028E570C3